MKHQSIQSEITKNIALIICFLLSIPVLGQDTNGKIMKKERIDANPNWDYSQAVKITDFSELLFISGQIPENEQNEVPKTIKEQCKYAWANVEKQLKNANMTAENLVKVNFFVSDRKYLPVVYRLRQNKLQDIKPALTIVITGIYREEWLLEIEAIAAR
ncbi:RidA family protein [Seonamhaeicola sp. ML3]|uniref:RidA family protein n=1 Tax=Seonamhaeicola sp. ML3 TaxID=2937786 RepID=UPI00200FEC45|nr:RidA family protein [Seonamhaeicola sp. ML3]